MVNEMKNINKIKEYFKTGSVYKNRFGELTFYKDNDNAYEIEDMLSEIVLDGDEMNIDLKGEKLLRDEGFRVIPTGTEDGELLCVKVIMDDKTFVVGGI